MRAAWLLRLGVLLVTPLAAQKPAAVCAAPRDPLGGAVMWPTPTGSSNDPRTAPTARGLQGLLTGTYDILVVTTEGVERPTVERWQFRLMPSDSVAASRCTFGACDSDRSFPLVGHKGVSLSARDSLKLVRRQLLDSAEFDVSFTPKFGRLSIQEVTASDAGGFYMYPDALTAQGFSGRWSDAGMLGVSFKRDNVRVVERPSGYFCATKRQP